MPWTPTSPLPAKRTVAEKVPPSNDFALLIDFLNELKNAGILDTVSAKASYVQTNVPMKLVFSDADPGLTSTEELWVQTGGGSIPESGFFADRASSPCSTVPPYLISTTLTLVNGGANAAYAVNKDTRTYTSIRFLLTGFTTAPTDFYCVVWGTDGSVLASTASLVSQITAAGTLITGTLKAPLALSAGVGVFLGVVCIGGSGLTIARGVFAGAVTGYALLQQLSPQPTALAMTGQGGFPSTGTPPTLVTNTGRTSNVPWLELV